MEADHEQDVVARSVAVGVDGSPESRAATRFAVELAEAHSLDLLLVHAYELPSLNVPMDAGIAEGCLQTAEKLVSDTSAELSLPSSVRVETLIRPELPSVLLQSVARSAPFLVVGQDHVSWGERLLFGPVASLVGQRAACPVFVVPGAWRATKTGTYHSVVVALDEPAGAQPTLAMAFREAQRLGTGVLVLHASPYGTPADRLKEQDTWLHDELAEWQQRYPRVSSQTQVVGGDPDASLVRWSKSAALVVLGRRHRFGWGPWTHAVLRHVVKQTHCPLLIVPSRATHT